MIEESQDDEATMIELMQEVLKLTFSTENGTFSIIPKDDSFPAVLEARMAVSYTVNGHSACGLLKSWTGCRTSVYEADGRQGRIKAVRYILPEDSGGIGYELDFAVAEEYPLALWKVKILNHGSTPVLINRITLMDVEGGELGLAGVQSPADLGFYYNGWASWSPSGWVAGDGRMPRTRLGGLQVPMIDYTGTPLPGNAGQFSSDFFAAVGDRITRRGFVLGFLSQKQHFGSVVADFRKKPGIKMWANGDEARLDPGMSMETDWAVFNPILLDHREPMEKYFEAVARENDIRVPAEAPVGWCSWYHFYTHLSETDVRANLQTIIDQQKRLPIQLVQIDDGFESRVGDWFTFLPTFPEGVKPLAQEISREGLIPGLWLAPFTAHPKSEIFKNHPDWILRQANGKPVNAGWGWGALFTGLDLTVPDALDYACSTVHTAAHEWGYPYLKLDFLYSAALPGKYHDKTQTRARVLRMGMEAIRSAVGPDVTLLGCGAPFGPMLGLVDAMRIGPDVSGDWTPHVGKIGSFIRNEPAMPCARNSIRDILTRAGIHKHWWINDPDCLLIRPDTNLSLTEVQSLATAIAMTGGSLLVSDDLPKLPAERMRIAEVLLPVIGERARVLDWFDSEMPSKLRLDLLNDSGAWHLLTRFNWSEKPAEIRLDPVEYDLDAGAYWVCDFWNGKVGRVEMGTEYTAHGIPAHGCVTAALRPVRGNLPQYLGSDLHFSMGQEVAEWKSEEDYVRFTIRLPRCADGRVWVSIPWPKFNVEVNGEVSEKGKQKGGILEIPVMVDGFATIEIRKQ